MKNIILVLLLMGCSISQACELTEDTKAQLLDIQSSVQMTEAYTESIYSGNDTGTLNKKALIKLNELANAIQDQIRSIIKTKVKRNE